MKRKITIQIKNRFTNEVLFKYTIKDNTIKDTLSEGVRRGINFTHADLGGAHLVGANLFGARLRGANLYGAKLAGAELSHADFTDADLRYARFDNAILHHTCLIDADLRFADLYGVDLSEANIYDAVLWGVGLIGASHVPYIPLACPSDGEFIGWKKVMGRWLVKLRIPEDAERSSATTRKCRCDKAEVLAITDLDGKNPIEKIINFRCTTETIYEVGKMVYPDAFNEDRWNECSHGIHFFINKQDALDY